ncbi:MAG TPA: pirin family protein, partial [Gammaproteobacteria bacterium]|nr:pirin family protein [Gammaproteobacteria bacterium]
DEMGPAQFPPGEGMNVRPHPHIGLATVTFLFSGTIMHRDSLGCAQPIEPGAVNLMTAGRGIVHSERTPPQLLESGQFLHGIQTWMVLPDEEQEIEPAFVHYRADSLPQHEEDDVRSTVIIGEAFNLRSPVEVRLQTLYLEQRYAAGGRCRLPETAEQRGVYVVSGRLEIDGSHIEAGTLAVLGPGHVSATAAEPCHVMIVGGEPVSARHVKWNFVHSSRQRIDSAAKDWIEGRFAAVPDDTEFIPLPEDFFE